MKHFPELFFYELKKIISNRPAVFLMMFVSALILFLTGQQYIAIPGENHTWETGQFPEGGMMDEEFFSSLRAWYGEYGNEGKEPPWYSAAVYVSRVFRYGSHQNSYDHETWNADLFYQLRQQAQRDFSDSFYLNEDEVRYWEEKEKSIVKPFPYRNTDSVRNLRESFQFTLTLTCILIAVFLSDSFAGESAKRMDELIFTGKFGHRETLMAKLISGIVFSFGIGCWMLISAHLTTFLFSGLNALDAPWYMVEPFSSLSVNAGNMLLLHVVCFILGCLLTGLFAMILSLLFNKTTAAMGAVFGFIVVDLFVKIPPDRRIISQIRSLTPLSVLTNTRVQDMRLIKLFGKYLMTFQTAPICYLLCGFLLAVLLILLFRRRCGK